MTMIGCQWAKGKFVRPAGNSVLTSDKLERPPALAESSVLANADDSSPYAQSYNYFQPDGSIEESFESLASVGVEPTSLVEPRTSKSGLPTNFQNMSLQQAISQGLQDTTILRSLNATVLNNPASVTTSYETEIGNSNPIFGTAAALSAFDSRLQADLTYSRNDDVFNNSFLGGGATEVQQDLTSWNWNLAKTDIHGTSYSLSSSLSHDNNDNVSSIFAHSWRTNLEATVRKPLLQGAGEQFNSIAGPNARPGFRFSSGIVVSRLNNDISNSDFERGLRDYVDEVTNAYWDLYFSFRTFGTAQASRDIAFATWQSVKSRFENDLPGGEADAEAQAREQYFEFQQRVNDALSGTRGNDAGVLQAEANLRRLLGLPQTSERFIRPVDEPLEAAIAYDWQELVANATNERVEIRRQQKQIRKREFELVAARNFTKPRLDAVATWRNNGFGDDLTGTGSRFASATKNATDFDHDEWAFALEYNLPIGMRQGHAAVRHAELNLQREVEILEEQSQQIVHDLGTSWRELDRAFNDLNFARERHLAAKQTVMARTAAYEEDLASINDLLEAQRRLGVAETDWYLARTRYSKANYQLMRESGQLLQNLAVFTEVDSSSVAEIHRSIELTPVSEALPSID